MKKKNKHFLIQYTMNYHLCVEIEGEMKRIHKEGKTVLFDGEQVASLSDAFAQLVKAQKEGKKFYTGCDNMTKEGRCGGHKD